MKVIMGPCLIPLTCEALANVKCQQDRDGEELTFGMLSHLSPQPSVLVPCSQRETEALKKLNNIPRAIEIVNGHAKIEPRISETTPQVTLLHYSCQKPQAQMCSQTFLSSAPACQRLFHTGSCPPESLWFHPAFQEPKFLFIYLIPSAKPLPHP